MPKPSGLNKRSVSLINSDPFWSFIYQRSWHRGLSIPLCYRPMNFDMVLCLSIFGIVRTLKVMNPWNLKLSDRSFLSDYWSLLFLSVFPYVFHNKFLHKTSLVKCLNWTSSPRSNIALAGSSKGRGSSLFNPLLMHYLLLRTLVSFF